MTFTCDRVLLNEALTHAGRAVSNQTSAEILKGIHLEFRDGTLTVTGNNLELGIIASLPADVPEPGAIVLDARMITEITRRTDGDELTLAVQKTGDTLKAAVTSDLSSFDIPALPADNYPTLPEVAGFRTLEMPQAALKRLIAQTLFSATVSESRAMYTGALFDVEPSQLTVVALDGHRLAMRHEPVISDEAYQMIVPGVTLRELERILTADEEASVTLRVGENHLLVSLPNRTIISRLLDGEFLKYKNAIPKDGSFTAAIGVRAMLGSLERVGLLIDEKIKNPVRMTFSKDRLQFLCQTPLGRALDTLYIGCDGEMEIGFNHRYLLEALRRMDSARFILKTAGPNKPCLLLPEDDDNALFMVLPVRLKADEEGGAP